MIRNEDMPSSKITKYDNMSSDEDDHLTYAEIREKRMKQNMEMFDILGINEAAETLANNLKQDANVKKSAHINNKIDSKSVSPLVPVRRSLRIANIHEPLNLFEGNSINQKSSSINDSFNAKNLTHNVFDKDSIHIPKTDANFFKNLNADINEPVNFDTCDFNKFTKVVKSLKMDEPSIRVTKTRIYSLAIHPSKRSLIIAAGDLNGNVALYNRSNNLKVPIYQIHDAPINCLSFCSWDTHKLFSTSHDGSVRCGDLVKCTFDTIYKSSLWATEKMNNTHTTWHTEYERNLLIGSGSGRVDIIDTRIPNEISGTIYCHNKSVRTVQCHPLHNHYFLTSSGLGEACLFDIRKTTSNTINPVLKFKHSKALTSAFFSATGINMVSTSNEDVIKIFNTTTLNDTATKPITEIKHNNHTGAWVSVFKAKWNPGRDDVFFVGSLQLPKRIQIYRSNGLLLHDLISNNLLTYCPVIEVHPTQAIYVGANSSGHLHIFRTLELL